MLELSLRQSTELCATWHGRDDGRLMYAFTPRFAVSCSAAMLRSVRRRPRPRPGAYWQTHLSEDRGEIAEVRRLFPEAIDYTDVYDRAGGLTPRAILAHAIHLSDREVARLAESGAVIAHCPSSNLFLASGAMPLARYLAAGIRIGLGSDVAAGPDAPLFSVMRAGAYTQNALRAAGLSDAPPLTPRRLAAARARWAAPRRSAWTIAIGSVEVGKEADLIVVDPSVTLPLEGVGAHDDGPVGRDAQPAHLSCASVDGARRVGARAPAARLNGRASARLPPMSMDRSHPDPDQRRGAVRRRLPDRRDRLRAASGGSSCWWRSPSAC